MSRPRYFVIMGAMRTGSNLLETTLDGYEGLKGLGELFNPQFIGAPGVLTRFTYDLSARNRAPLEFLEAAIAAHPDETPGFRLFDGHDPVIWAHVASDPECARILLTREPLESFISLEIAEATGQWLLVREEDRRLARVHFDADACIRYRDRIVAHYAKLRAMMRAAGRAWIELDYADLGACEALNRAARHIGSLETKARLTPCIVRQNPPSLIDRVSNPEALTPYLRPRRPGPETPPPPALDLMVVSRRLELIYAAAPGVGDGPVRALIADLEAAAGGAERPPVFGIKRHHLARRRRRGAFIFTFTRHPAARLLDAFARLEVDSAFETARVAIARDYGARDFDAFLSFVADNLAGRTSAPSHPAWIPQSTLLAAHSAEAPLDFIGRVEDAAAGASTLLMRFGLGPAPEIVARFAACFSAPPRLTATQEARLFSIYESDYQKFSYTPRA